MAEVRQGRSELASAWEAWLDASSLDAAATDRLASALAAEWVDHRIVGIKAGGGSLRTDGGRPRRAGYRARCSCRWRSAYYPSPDAARLVGAEHVRRATGRG